MYNKLSVEDIIINKREIKVKFSAKGAIAKYFNAPYSFNVAYSEDINNVPKGLAVIPFICNVLPIIWLLDATLELPELDHDFYNHINEIKAGYMKMYPMLKFGGKINATTTNCKQITPPLLSLRYSNSNAGGSIFQRRRRRVCHPHSACRREAHAYNAMGFRRQT